jgi:phosphatidylglycerol:prolipoprotein diacylglycerol transferase
MRWDFARKGEPAALAPAMTAFALAGGLVGARLHLAIESASAFVTAPLTFLVARSGFVWYGGLAGGVVATLWPIRHWHVRWASAADTAAPALALGLGIGRIGCHLAGDGDWGTPTTLPWGIAYTRGVAPWPYPAGIRVHPAALYECIALVVVFTVLWQLRGRVRPTGAIFAIYLVLAGAIRFLVEVVRTGTPVALGMTEAQWMSGVLVVGAGAWLAAHGRWCAPCERSAPGPGDGDSANARRISPHAERHRSALGAQRADR